GSPSSTSQGTAAILTNRSVAKGTASFVIAAGFAGAWRSASQNITSGGAVTTQNSSRVQLTFNNLPSGVTLTLSLNPTVSTSSGKPSAGFLLTAGPPATTCPTNSAAPGACTIQVTSAANTATIEMISPSLT